MSLLFIQNQFRFLDSTALIIATLQLLLIQLLVVVNTCYIFYYGLFGEVDIFGNSLNSVFDQTLSVLLFFCCFLNFGRFISLLELIYFLISLLTCLYIIL